MRLEIDGLPWLAVVVNGRGPYAFGVDTGYLGLCLSADVAAELGLPMDAQAVAHGAADARVCHHGRVESIRVGKRRAATMPVIVMDCSHASENAGAEIHGYLGSDFLKGTAVTINVLDLVLSLTDDGATPADVEDGKRPSQPGSADSATHCSSPLLCLCVLRPRSPDGPWYAGNQLPRARVQNSTRTRGHRRTDRDPRPYAHRLQGTAYPPQGEA